MPGSFGFCPPPPLLYLAFAVAVRSLSVSHAAWAAEARGGLQCALLVTVDLVYRLELSLQDLLFSGAGSGAPVSLQVGGQVGTPAPTEPLPTPRQALEGFPQVSRVPAAAAPPQSSSPLCNLQWDVC